CGTRRLGLARLVFTAAIDPWAEILRRRIPVIRLADSGIEDLLLTEDTDSPKHDLRKILTNIHDCVIASGAVIRVGAPNFYNNDHCRLLRPLANDVATVQRASFPLPAQSTAP